MSPSPDSRRQDSHLLQAFVMFGLTLTALLIRFGHPVIITQEGTFPIHDGGLFYAIIDQIIAKGGAFPTFIDYNALQIPFAYPPLAFYLSAAVVTLFNTDITTVLFVLPGILSALMVPAAYLLLRDLLEDDRLALAASLLFAAAPNVIKMFNAGGGITRSLGAVFMLLFLWQLLGLYKSRQWQRVPLTVLLGALTVLTHPPATFVTVKSGLVFFLFFGLHRAGFIQSAAVAVGVLVVTAFWWLPVIRTHSVDVFFSGASTGGELVPLPMLLMIFPHTGEWLLPYTAVLGNVALMYSLWRRRWFYPVWIFALYGFGRRGAEAALVIPFVAMLVLMLADLWEWMPERPPASSRWARWGEGTVLGTLLTSALLVWLFNPWTLFGEYGTAFYRLSSPEITAMEWLSDNTLSDATVLPLTETTNWAFDTIQEWLPVLAERESVITVQGTEWLPDDTYTNRRLMNADLTNCYTEDITCLQAWQAEHDIAPDYLFVAVPTTRLAVAIAASDDYELVYDEGVYIYRALPE